MKKLILISIISILLFSCNDNKKVNDGSSIVEDSGKYKDLYGFWVGEFVADVYKEGSTISNNKLNIAIKSIIGKKVIAQSIVAGNKRPLTGEIDTTNNRLTFVLSEPGDDKYDGKFEFELIDNTLTGTWTAYDQSLTVTKRTFKLERKEFVYNGDVMLPENQYLDQYSGQDSTITDTIDNETETYVEKYYRAASESVYKINSSTHKFTEEELKNLKKLDLEILRNTIFARHGYTFKKRAYRQFFDYVDWYVPVTDNVDTELTAIEKDNIKLLVRFEKYAADNYDTFSR